MSGAFGWISNNQPNSSGKNGNNYDSAQTAYQYNSAVGVTRVNPKAASARVLQSFTFGQQVNVPDGKHTLRSTAANVIVVAQDVTGSMRDWPQEIFKRLPLMYADACKYLGTDDLEILFIAHGDARTDQHPVQVAQFGKGAELDRILASFSMRCGGGGQGTESHELVAFYLLNFVDTSSARNVYAFFVTDEAGCDAVSAALAKKFLPVKEMSEDMQTDLVFQALGRKMNVYAVLCETYSYDPQPIEAWWRTTLGERVVPLNDHRRIVDVMLGTIAKVTGQLDSFTQDLSARQAGTAYGNQNVQTVLSSIALIGKGTPSDPARIPSTGRTRSLLPPGQ